MIIVFMIICGVTYTTMDDPPVPNYIGISHSHTDSPGPPNTDHRSVVLRYPPRTTKGSSVAPTVTWCVGVGLPMYGAISHRPIKKRRNHISCIPQQMDRMDRKTEFSRDGAFVRPRPGDTKIVYMQEHGVSTRHTLVTHGVRSCSTLAWFVPLLAVFGLAHIAAGVSDVDADAVGSMEVAVEDVVKRQVEPVLHEAASYGLPFVIHIGHGYNTLDNLQVALLTFLTAFVADPAHNAKLYVSDTCRAFSRAQVPWGSTRVSITDDGKKLLVEEKVTLMRGGPGLPVENQPPGESATLPGYNGPGLMFRCQEDGKMWELFDRQTLAEFFVSTCVWGEHGRMH